MLGSDEVEARILAALPGAMVELAGEGCNFEVSVLWDQFEGLPPLARQKRIIELFQSEIQSGEIHALSITARTVAEASARPGLVQIEGLS